MYCVEKLIRYLFIHSVKFIECEYKMNHFNYSRRQIQIDNHKENQSKSFQPIKLANSFRNAQPVVKEQIAYT